MAQKVQILMLDDLDGQVAEDGETVTFGIDGRTYEIDLNKAHAHELREGLAPYVAHGRPVRAASVKGAPRTRSSRQDTAAIREWAKGKGYEVNERGRIPGNIVAEYEASH